MFSGSFRAWFSQQLSVSGDGDSLQLGNVTLSRMLPAEPGVRLDGTFGYATFVDTTGVAGSGSVSGDHTVAFGSDGRLSLKDFVDSLVSGDTVGGTTSSRATGSGAYRLEGYLVRFAITDGGTERHIFFILPRRGETNAAAIDGAVYLRLG